MLYFALFGSFASFGTIIFATPCCFHLVGFHQSGLHLLTTHVRRAKASSAFTLGGRPKAMCWQHGTTGLLSFTTSQPLCVLLRDM